MKDSDREQFDKLMRTYAGCYGKTVTAEMSVVYWQQLNGHSLAEVQKAFDACVATEDYFPRVSVLLRNIPPSPQTYIPEVRRELSAEDGLFFRRSMAYVWKCIQEKKVYDTDERDEFVQQSWRDRDGVVQPGLSAAYLKKRKAEER